MHDVVIKGGTVVDGTGREPFTADIAIDEGMITSVEAGAGPAREVIDGRGRIVTPGFIDIHTHYDGQATWDHELAPSSCHGVTTAVMGNCGVGFAPVRPDDHQRLIELMEGVEDLPGAVLAEGLPWTWESFEEYLDHLETRHFDIDLCAQLPHGPLRLYVMGERAARLEPASDSDLQQMRALASQAVRAGAIGFTTSRTINHRTASGDPTPSLRASHEELAALAAGLADAGSGVLEVVSDFWPDPDREMSMLRSLVEGFGVPLSLSLAQSHRHPDAWRPLLEAVAEASAAGLPIRAQVAPRPIGVLLTLETSTNPFAGLPTHDELNDLGLTERVAALSEPSRRGRLLEQAAMAPPTFDPNRVFLLGDPPDYEPPADRSISHIAARHRKSIHEVVLDALCAEAGTGMLFAPFANYAELNLDACGEMLAHPDTVIGLGDGGAHVGTICDASFPTYALSHWGRDRVEARLPVEVLVRKLTSLPAQVVGLSDRGMIAAGMRADLNVIDWTRLGCLRPEVVADLPSGGVRLLQRATGYDATLVSGTVIARDGAPTGARPGRLVRAGERTARAER